MANYKPYNKEQTFIQAIDPVAFKRNNPLLRVIDDFIDEHLPIEKFSLKVSNDAVGAAALDPRLVTKILIYSVATGVRSYRDIEDRLRWDPSFMILSAQTVFDHSTLCRFISKHGEALTEFFTILVYVLIKEGHMTKGFFGTDGTKIKAWAGKDFTGTLEDFERRSKKLQKRIEEILSKMGNDDPDPNKPSKLRELEKKKEKIDNFLNEVKKNGTSIRRDEKINLNDLDARSMKDKDTTYQGYNFLLSVDSNHFIASYDLFTCTADQPHAQPMIKNLREQLNDPLTDSILAFDAGFHSADNILFFEQENLNVYVPEGQAQDGTKIFKKKTIGTKDCELQKADGVVTLNCPGGQSMIGKLSERPSSDRSSYRFIPEKDKCRACAYLKPCYGERKRKTFEPNKVSVDSVEARQRMREKVASDFGRAIRNKRFSTGEHVNAEIKDQMRVRQFHHKGKKKLKLISCLLALGYNFRRLAAVS